MKKLGTVTGEGFESIVWEHEGRVWFVGDLDVDVDGSGGNPDHDPYFQPDTTLHHNGKAINPYEVSGMVVPEWLPKAVGPIVMGCRGRVTNLSNLRSAEAVVHDSGPLRKTGEGTPHLAIRLGINPNPNTGGEDNPVILYELWPGAPAIVDGIEYTLQKA